MANKVSIGDVKKNSLGQDFAAGEKQEIETINGTIVEGRKWKFVCASCGEEAELFFSDAFSKLDQNTISSCTNCMNSMREYLDDVIGETAVRVMEATRQISFYWRSSYVKPIDYGPRPWDKVKYQRTEAQREAARKWILSRKNGRRFRRRRS